MTPRSWLGVLLLAATPAVAAGQDLARRVAETPDGAVHFSFATRDGVEICARGVRIYGNRMQWRDDGTWRPDEPCRTGSVEVELRLSEGRVRAVDVLRAGEEGTRDARKLGEVAPDQAVGYFLQLARSDAGARGARDAVFPAMLADVDEVWRDLLDLARDRDVTKSVRTSALFWLGQEAAEAATQGLADVARADDEAQEVRDAAVFALSQRPPEEGVPVLMDLARTADQAKTRRTAFFWLAQSKDDRVVPFFEEILLGNRGG